MNQATERDIKYQAIMRNLVRRYITQVRNICKDNCFFSHWGRYKELILLGIAQPVGFFQYRVKYWKNIGKRAGSASPLDFLDFKALFCSLFPCAMVSVLRKWRKYKFDVIWQNWAYDFFHDFFSIKHDLARSGSLIERGALQILYLDSFSCEEAKDSREWRCDWRRCQRNQEWHLGV